MSRLGSPPREVRLKWTAPSNVLGISCFLAIDLIVNLVHLSDKTIADGTISSRAFIWASIFGAIAWATAKAREISEKKILVLGMAVQGRVIGAIKQAEFQLRYRRPRYAPCLYLAYDHQGKNFEGEYSLYEYTRMRGLYGDSRRWISKIISESACEIVEGSNRSYKPKGTIPATVFLMPDAPEQFVVYELSAYEIRLS